MSPPRQKKSVAGLQRIMGKQVDCPPGASWMFRGKLLKHFEKVGGSAHGIALAL
jgi:hypothetical protein